MKTLMTAALLAALAVAGLARADEPGKVTGTTPTKPAVEKVPLEQVGETLEKMGYTPQPVKDKNGKVLEYNVQATRGSNTVTMTFAVSPSGTKVWLSVGLIVFDEKFPATQDLLLELLSKHDDLWPAYVAYYPDLKFARLSMAMDSANFGPAALRPQIERIFDKFLIVLDAFKKVQAAQQKGKEGGGQTTPNPIP